MVYHLMSDEDVTRIMRHPQVAIASDSGLLQLWRGRAASPRLREQRAGAGQVRADAITRSRWKRRFER